MAVNFATVAYATGIPQSALIGLDELSLLLLQHACTDDAIRQWCVQYPWGVANWARQLSEERRRQYARAQYVEEASLKEERRFAIEMAKTIMRGGL